MFNKPVIAPPEGTFCVENPDGVFNRAGQHSLYDGGMLNEPTIPGDLDRTLDATTGQTRPFGEPI